MFVLSPGFPVATASTANSSQTTAWPRTELVSNSQLPASASEHTPLIPIQKRTDYCTDSCFFPAILVTYNTQPDNLL